MRKSVFKTHQDVMGMFEKRVAGKSYEGLAKEYGVDHTTIIYWCSKYGVKKNLPLHVVENIHITIKKRFTRKPSPVIPLGKYANIVYEKVNEGKSYAEYIKEDLARKKRL